MDIDALLEAFQDFEKKGKKETCPVLEQFLCHVAKTGQPTLSWSQFKTYFLFKLEKVMDDFQASAPEQRGLHNPNVEYVPFEEMKTRILKIVDGYNGIPFTIQRLCELLMDPKRNYTGTDKFLRGLEKNVMVVSCVYATSEKNGASTVNRMNGVMFPGNSSLYSDSRNVNGPGTPKSLNRPKLSLASSLSTNGLPDCPVSKEPESTTEEEDEEEEEEDQDHISETTPSENQTTANSGIKNKHSEEEEEDCDADKQEVKRLKFDEKEEEEEEEDQTTSEDKEPSCHKEPESMAEAPEPSKDSSGQEEDSEAPRDGAAASDHGESSSTKSESCEEQGDAHSLKSDNTEDQSEQPISSETRTSFEQENGDSSSSSSSSSNSSDGDGSSSEKQTPSSSNSPDLSTEGGADTSDSAGTAKEPEEHD
ncbi:serine/threonine-protein phosphatase 4 regulatory subunit 2-A-like [Salarias fasciatus]|uniref:Serine/threonine-protein phosphatase 4 regulatory subunit 2-A-like n=1 Tax=Salarias fasciatus TaxID=181472 RepID=A0A672J1H4_SALFA|nr:serine/threonine-protein phosphatase 4 regulatory subunit 2-A-like [Salarias fasciatus]